VQPNPRKAHGEFIFLIDRSNSMSKTNIQCIKVLCVGLYSRPLPPPPESGLKYLSCAFLCLASRELSVPKGHLFKISLSRDT
jgi:hypothetical protein